MRQTSFTVILALLADLRTAVPIPFADSVAPNLLARDDTNPPDPRSTATYNQAQCDYDRAHSGLWPDDDIRMAIACSVCGDTQSCDWIAAQDSVIQSVRAAATKTRQPIAMGPTPGTIPPPLQKSTGQPNTSGGNP